MNIRISTPGEYDVINEVLRGLMGIQPGNEDAGGLIEAIGTAMEVYESNEPKSGIYWVLWDYSSECELFRGTQLEVLEAQNSEVGGAGAGVIFPCIAGYKITKAVGRTNNNGLQLTMESA